MSARRAMKLLCVLLAAIMLGGCAGALFGPRPKPEQPDSSKERAMRGVGHYDEGRLDRAGRDFKKALAIDQADDRLPSMARDWANLAALALRQGEPEAAVEYLSRSAEIHRRQNETDAEARDLAAMATACDSAGRPDEAARLLDEALALVPDAGEPRLYVLNAKGAHLLAQGDAKGALGPLDEALRIAADKAEADPRLRAAAAHYMGRALLDQGQLEAAEKLLQEALALDRQVEHAAGIAADLDQLAALEAARGTPDEAFRLWERAFSIYVYLKDARRARQTLARLEEQGTKAKLAGDLSGLKDQLGHLEQAAAKARKGYSLGRTSTTQ